MQGTSYSKQLLEYFFEVQGTGKSVHSEQPRCSLVLWDFIIIFLANFVSITRAYVSLDRNVSSLFLFLCNPKMRRSTSTAARKTKKKRPRKKANPAPSSRGRANRRWDATSSSCKPTRTSALPASGFFPSPGLWFGDALFRRPGPAKESSKDQNDQRKRQKIQEEQQRKLAEKEGKKRMDEVRLRVAKSVVVQS